ncbi:MAG: hypothetical protein ACJ8OJ_22520 [Povalibacter sp.]
MSSAWEHLFAATVALASSGPIKRRLIEAYRAHLATLDRDELPKEIREEFCSVSNCLSCVRPMRGESAEQATIRKMSDFEAGQIAARIVNMLGAVARLQMFQRAPKLRAVNGAED